MSNSQFIDKARLIALVMGGCVGLSILVFSGLLKHPALGLDPARLQLLVLLMLALFSGVIASLVARAQLSSRDRAPGIAARLGLRAGLWCSVLAGGTITLLAALDAAGAGSAALDQALRTRMWLVLAVSLASLLPGMLCGFLGGVIGGSIMTTKRTGVRPAEIPQAMPWLKWIEAVVAGLAIAGLASPVCLMVKTPVVDPPPPIVVPPPLPPPFHYEPPVGITSAKLGEIQPDFTKTISGVQTSCPMAMSPDGVLIAFGDSSGPGSAVTVYDLHRFTKTVSIAVPGVPAGLLAWSPDQKSVACTIGEGAARRIWILNVMDARAVELPCPPGRDVPGGELYWWQEDELAFFPEDEAPLAFDLEKLLLTSLADSPHFKKLDETTQKKWTEGPRSEWPGQSGWKLGLRTLITSAVPPARRNPEMPWEFSGLTVGAYEHPQLPLAVGIRSMTVTESERIVCSPDGSKIAHLRDDQIEVTYMTKTVCPDLMIEVKMPQTPEEVAKNGWSSRVDSKELCLMICAPLKNPLNQAVVGPDYQQVHGLARLHEWKERKAVFILPIYDGSIQSDDVASTLHSWYSGKMSEWKAPGTQNWWSPIKFISSPLPDKIGEVELPQLLSFEQEPASLRVTKAVAKPRPAPPPPKTPEPPVAPPPPPPVVVTEQDVQAFLTEHHAKASRGDLLGMMLDYDSTVDFLDKGRIPLATIEAEERAQRQKWPKGREQVVGPIRVTGESGTWNASYTIEFYNENATGEWHKGRAELVMVVKAEGKRLSITSQRAKVYGVTDSRAIAPKAQPAAPAKGQASKAGPVTVPRPCFVTVTRAKDSPQVEFTDQISFAKGIVWHRTYRELSADGKVLRTCRAIYEGSGGVGADRNAARIYVEVQGWDQNFGDGLFTGVCAKNAAALVGRAFQFQFVPGGMVENQTGMVFQRVD